MVLPIIIKGLIYMNVEIEACKSNGEGVASVDTILEKLNAAEGVNELNQAGLALGIYFDLEGTRSTPEWRIIEGMERRFDEKEIPYEPCYLCGRPVSTKQKAHYVVVVQGGGTLLKLSGDDFAAIYEWHLHNDGGFMDSWVIGSKCKSKIPQEFYNKDQVPRAEWQGNV